MVVVAAASGKIYTANRILMQPDGRRAFVASTQANKVLVINLQE